MASEDINKYIGIRYERWLDYSKYHCALAGMEDEAVDVLNEVLCMLLQKDPETLARLYSSRKGEYVELDFYLLQMIKLNITSDTSPYKHKYKAIPKDDNIDLRRLNVPEELEENSDHSENILQQTRLVRRVFDELDLSERAKNVFSFRFFQGEAFSDWDGPEDKKELYDIYNGVLELIKMTIEGRILL